MGDGFPRKILWIHFPVWRELKREWRSSIRWISTLTSEYTFPFEGNWNFKLRIIEHALFNVLVSLSLNTLSRLKGIETLVSELWISWVSPCFLWIHFPVWRELKREWRSSIRWISTLTSEYTFPFEGNWNFKLRIIEHALFNVLVSLSLNTLSRLKGIETLVSELWISWVSPCFLWIHFPVWRELKLSQKLLRNLVELTLWIHFPVWREWKLFRDNVITIGQKISEYTFPFEGNRNVVSENAKEKRYILSEYTFPFEGNWNIPPKKLLKLKVYVSEYTFPFEGNWNKDFMRSPLEFYCPLNTLSRLKGIETIPAWSCIFFISDNALNTLSRLKGMETNRCRNRFCSASSILSEYTFPFEGNGN